jgi:NAD(P)-dependent dehydrogenase (short-subunit alcohol dehydrogenase family)
MTETGPTTLIAPRPQAAPLTAPAPGPRDASVAVVGAGDYIGGAICEKFAAEGYRVFGGRRGGEQLAPLKARIEAAGGRFEGRSLDARKEAQVAEFIAWADAEQPLEAVIFNVGANVNFPILETTERVFRKVWEMACQSGFFTGREAARRLLEHGRGSIFFTGATASLRGGVGYAAFASAKAGLRALAQSLARELGPRNIHVAHLIIDAGVDTAFVRERIAASRGNDALEFLAPDTLMNPVSIANAYWMLHQQSRDGWTFELDLRPFAETW